MRRFVTSGLVAGMVLATPLVAQEAPGAAAPATPEAAPAAPALTEYDASTVLATVNGTPITLGHVIALESRLPAQYQQLPDDVLMSGLLDQLIDQTLLATAQSASPETDPLAVKLHTENERRGTLASLGAEAAVADAVDDAKIKAAYDAALGDFTPTPEWNASHILVDSEEKATALKAEIDGGADFAEVAQANSSDGSAQAGGELGWFGPGRMVPEFETAVTGMEIGQVVGPIQTQFGWHLVKLNDRRDSAPPPVDEVRPQLEDQLRQEALSAKLATLRADAQIVKPAAAPPATAVRQLDLID